MELTCPSCGARTEVPGVLIPAARLTTTCPKCGVKFGGTVPARAEARRGTMRPSSHAERRPGSEPDGPEHKGPRNSADGSNGAAGGRGEDRPPLRVAAKGLDAARLAKLVVSDMLLYNRDKIESTVKDGRLLSAMAAEILEAWEFYKGRVGEEAAKGTPYFRDAMNSILGGGEPVL